MAGECNEMAEECPAWVDTLMDKMEMMGEIKKDTECLRLGMEKNEKILRRHDRRLTKVESDLRIIMDRRGMMFRALRFLGGIFGWKL